MLIGSLKKSYLFISVFIIYSFIYYFLLSYKYSSTGCIIRQCASVYIRTPNYLKKTKMPALPVDTEHL